LTANNGSDSERKLLGVNQPTMVFHEDVEKQVGFLESFFSLFII
jgi:hypothetical protein